MKFTIGDDTDAMLVRSISDEMHKCERAWRRFEALAGPNIHGIGGFQKPTHDAYVDFLHHLYEFYVAAMIRDAKDESWASKITGRKPEEARDERLSVEALRCVKSKIYSIEIKYAPRYENDISYYQKLLSLLQDSAGQLAPNFGQAFRRVRNHHAGHATTDRGEISVLDFFNKYHPLVYLLFQNAWSWRNASSTIGTDFDLCPPKKQA